MRSRELTHDGGRGLRSTVNAAVLALVIARPSTAYEVGRRFVEQYSSLFASSQRNVYTALERLEAQRLIERFAVVPPAAEPGAVARVHLRATAAGARAYRAWLASPLEGGAPYGRQMDPGVPRRDVLIRLQAVRDDDHAAIGAILNAYEQVLLRELRQPGAEESSLVTALLADERALAVQGQLQWVAMARERLLLAAAREEGGAEGSRRAAA